MPFLPTPNAKPRQPFLLNTANDQRPTESSLTSMSNGLCGRVFQMQQAPTGEKDVLDAMDSKFVSTSSLPKQLSPVVLCPPSAPVTAEPLEFSFKAAPPYNPPQAHYKIHEGKFNAAHLVAPPEKNQTPQNKLPKQKASPASSGQKSSRSKVLAVAKWKIPEEVLNKSDFIWSEVAMGRDVDFVLTSAVTSSSVSWRKRRGHKRMNPLSVEDEIVVREPKRNSAVCGVEYDTRYMQYDDSPYGFLDQLVQRPMVFANPSCKNDDVFGQQCLQSIPDPPINSTKTSRVGVGFQARVCRHKEDYHDKRNGSYLPEYETFWDPVLANEAEKNGQNIDGFLLCNNMSLAEREMRMKLLHMRGYDVAYAQEEFDRIRRFGWVSKTEWTRDEELKFKGLLESARWKNFKVVAKEMNRSQADCLTHYYVWKRTSPAYAEKKTSWKQALQGVSKNDYCAVCDDGGSLLVLCDQCDDAYHLSCLKPALSAIPDGDWFCPICVSKKSAQEGGYISRSPCSSSASMLWSSPASFAALRREANRTGHERKRAPPREIFPSVSVSGRQARGAASRPSCVGSPATHGSPFSRLLSISGSGRQAQGAASRPSCVGSAATHGSPFSGQGQLPSPGQDSSTQSSIFDLTYVLSDKDSVFSEPADV